jgi:hypothetical protein
MQKAANLAIGLTPLLAALCATDKRMGTARVSCHASAVPVRISGKRCENEPDGDAKDDDCETNDEEAVRHVPTLSP